MNNIAAGKDIDDMGESLNNVDKVLSSVGLSLRDESGQIRDLGDVLDEVAAKWNTYTRNQQNQISTAIAGTRQANYFKAAMADWEEVLEGTELAMNASGSATERMAIWSESLQGKLNSLKDSWDKFIMGLGSSEVFEDIIDILTGLLDILDLLINKIPILSNLIKVTLVAQAINVLLGSLKQLKTLFGKSGLSFGGLINTQTIKDVVSGFTDANAVIKETVKTTEGATQVTTHYAVALGKAAKAAVNFAITNPAVAVAALTAAVVAGIAAFALYSNSIGAAEKKYEDLAKKAEDSQAEVDSTNEKLEAIDSQIQAINEKGTLTLADKSQLEELESQRKELELILATKEAIAEADARNAANAAKDVINKKYGNETQNYSTDKKEYNGTNDSLARYGGFLGAESDNLSASITTYDILISKREALLEQGKSLSEEEEKWLSDATSAMGENLTQLQEYKSQMEAAGDTSSKEYQIVISAIDAVQSRLAPEEWKSVKLSDLIDTNSGIQDVKSQIEEFKNQLSNGLIDENTYNQKVKDAIYSIANNQEIQQAIKNIFGNDITVDEIANSLAEEFGVALNQAVNEIDISSFDNLKNKIETEMSNLDISFDVDSSNLEDVINGLGDTTNLTDLGNALDEIGSSIENYKSEISSLGNYYDSLASNVDNATAMLDAISENMDALTGQTQLTGKETEDLVNELASIGPVVDVSTGQVYNGMDLARQTILNTGASAGEMQTSVQSFMGGVTNAGNNTINAMNYVLEAIIKVKQALAGALNTAASFVDKASSTINKVGNSLGGKLVSKFFGIDASDIASATEGLSSVANSLRNEATSISNSIQTEQAALIQQTQQYQAKLENAGKAGKKAYNDSISKGAGSAKKATDDLTDALKEQYEAEKAILEQQKEQLQMQKELLNAEKERLNDAKDAINDLIDMTMDMLKQQYEDEIDALDKQKDALEDQLDAFEKKIDKQKEILDLQRQEEEHQDELAEKNKTIADIQAELAEIQFDNSAEGQKRRLELLEQLNQAQQDLNDYQSDHDYEVKNDALDKELEAYKQMIDAKKELIDQQEEYIREQMENDYNLYMQAIQLIEGRSGEFYNQLVEWNRVSAIALYKSGYMLENP